VLTYEGHGHKKAAERIYKINALLPLFGEDAKSSSDKEMARRIVPKLLKGRARVKYFDKDGHKLHKKKDVLKLCRGILKGLAIKNEVNAEQREHDKDRRFCNKDTNQDDDKGEVKDKFSKMKNPCHKHNKQQEWNDCPDNPGNKSRTEKEGKVSATEIQSTQKKNFVSRRRD
jgi:hypothetical protein